MGGWWRRIEVKDEDEARQDDAQGKHSLGLHSHAPFLPPSAPATLMTHYFIKHQSTATRTRSFTLVGTLRTRDRSLSPLSLCRPPSLGARDARRPLRDIRLTVSEPPAHDTPVRTIATSIRFRLY